MITLNSIIQTKDNGYVVVSYHSPISNATNWSNISVVKLGSSGNIIWNKTLGGSNDYYTASSIVQTSDGGYTIAGSAKSKGAGGYDFWIIRLDSNGNH